MSKYSDKTSRDEDNGYADTADYEHLIKLARVEKSIEPPKKSFLTLYFLKMQRDSTGARAIQYSINNCN